MMLSNKLYTILKWIAQYLLPALGASYFALAGIWGLPYSEQVVGTITVIDIFLGTVLGISTNQYKKSDLATNGQLLIDTSNPAKDIYRLALGDTLDNISGMKTITLTVKPGCDLSQDN